MAFLNLFKDWVFLIEPGRSLHNLGAAAWKNRSLSVVNVFILRNWSQYFLLVITAKMCEALLTK